MGFEKSNIKKLQLGPRDQTLKTHCIMLPPFLILRVSPGPYHYS